MSRSDWVVIDSKKQEMRCNRCGVTEPLSTINGRLFDFAIGVMKAFTNTHRKCKEEL
jgi:hypothetical protein